MRKHLPGSVNVKLGDSDLQGSSIPAQDTDTHLDPRPTLRQNYCRETLTEKLTSGVQECSYAHIVSSNAQELIRQMIHREENFVQLLESLKQVAQRLSYFMRGKVEKTALARLPRLQHWTATKSKKE
uniref:Uncharacterized protein n=1 Tax=Ditylenchus dipsaci TaxID=166011 RepID=A0A915E6J4_9BILA